MRELLHGAEHWLEPFQRQKDLPSIASVQEDEDNWIEHLNTWMLQRDLPAGQSAFELVDEASGKRFFIDLAWPDGVQAGFSSPAAILLNTSQHVLATVSQAGYLCFTDVISFQQYVENKIINDG